MPLALAPPRPAASRAPRPTAAPLSRQPRADRRRFTSCTHLRPAGVALLALTLALVWLAPGAAAAAPPPPSPAHDGPTHAAVALIAGATLSDRGFVTADCPVGDPRPARTISLSSARRKAAREGKLLFVDFTARWCLPCRMMEETAFADEQVLDYLRDHYVSIQIDVENFDGLAIQQQYGVETLPAMLIFSSDGRELGRIGEAIGPTALLTVLREHDRPQNRPAIPGPAPEHDWTEPFARLANPHAEAATSPELAGSTEHARSTAVATDSGAAGSAAVATDSDVAVGAAPKESTAFVELSSPAAAVDEGETATPSSSPAAAGTDPRLTAASPQLATDVRSDEQAESTEIAVLSDDPRSDSAILDDGRAALGVAGAARVSSAHVEPSPQIVEGTATDALVSTQDGTSEVCEGQGSDAPAVLAQADPPADAPVAESSAAVLAQADPPADAPVAESSAAVLAQADPPADAPAAESSAAVLAQADPPADTPVAESSAAVLAQADPPADVPAAESSAAVLAQAQPSTAAPLDMPETSAHTASVAGGGPRHLRSEPYHPPTTQRPLATQATAEQRGRAAGVVTDEGTLAAAGDCVLPAIYSLQVGVFADRDNAVRTAEHLRATTASPILIELDVAGPAPRYRLYVGRFTDLADASAAALTLERGGFPCVARALAMD